MEIVGYIGIAVILCANIAVVAFVIRHRNSPEPESRTEEDIWWDRQW